jgi:hypothetical protein
VPREDEDDHRDARGVPSGMERRLTIAIPLHGAERWLDGIIETVGKAPDWSRVVISDASGLDDAPGRLRNHFGGNPRVEVIERGVTLDWCSHLNLMLGEASSEYFCWMPQDDLIRPDRYFELLTGALDRDPTAVLAFPTLWARMTKGRLRRREVGEAPIPAPRRLSGAGRPQDAALAMLPLRGGWNPGFAWRGVFRREIARPLPVTTGAADVTWAFSMALAGRLLEVPDAAYLKRFHRGSAHRGMRLERGSREQELYRAEVEARLADDPPELERVARATARIVRRNRAVRRLWLVVRAGRFLAGRPRFALEPETGPGGWRGR